MVGLWCGWVQNEGCCCGACHPGEREALLFVESRDTCLPVKDQEGQRNKVKVELSACIPSLERSVWRRPCLSPYAPARAGTLPSGGRALPSLCPAVVHLQPPPHCCSCPGSINLIQHWVEGGGRGEEGPRVCLAGATLLLPSKALSPVAEGGGSG